MKRNKRLQYTNDKELKEKREIILQLGIVSNEIDIVWCLDGK